MSTQKQPLGRAAKPAPPADDAPHLLLVDDDTRIRSLMSRYLTDHGYRITTAAHAADADARMKAMRFDLLILDVMMPGENGMVFAERLRRNSDIPILMLTARAEPDQRIIGLEIGVDDYLGKPFQPRELLLRIGNVLRRHQRQEADPVPEILRIGALTFHVASGELSRDNESVRLTEREREMLRIFARNIGKTVPRAELAQENNAGSERSVDVQINRLRRKIEPDPANPLLLQTVRGIGYQLITR